MWSYTFLPRLGLPLIGAGLKAAGHDVVIYCPQFSPIDWDDLLSADLVGISTTTSTAPAGYEIAARVREHGVPIIVGGSHVTFMADEALAHADYVARGEGGDALMLELIDVPAGRTPAGHASPASRSRASGEAVHNPDRAACQDLDTLPVPDLTLIAGSSEQKGITPIMTSWGCPFACNFCSVTAMFGRKYRYRSAEHIMAEIEAKQPKSIFFYDDNFAADKRRLKTLLRMMIASGRKISVVGAGAHRRRLRPRAPRAHARLRLRPRRARPRVREPGDPRRLRQVAERRRHRPRPRHAAQVRHQDARHVRPRRRQRHRRDRPRDGPASRASTTSAR